MWGLSQFWGALEGLGIKLDDAEDAVLGGPDTETISMRTAKAAAAGNIWACRLCHILSILVQHHHCTKQLHGIAMNKYDYARAIIWLTVWIWFPILLLTMGLFLSLYVLFVVLVASTIISVIETGTDDVG